MTPHPISHYAHELRADLPAGTFEPATSRLWWLPVHLAVIGLGATAMVAGWVPWPLWIVIGLVIGVSYACLTFLAHETMHGAVVRGRVLRGLVGWLGFLPFVLSTRLWVRWHNRVHHAHTGQPLSDPDCYPTLELYQRHRHVRFAVDHFSLGGGRWRGLLSLLLGFSVQSAQVLIRGRAYGLSAREHRLALAETGLGVAFWVGIAALVGLWPFLFIFALPLLVSNVLVMSFILTNHSLNPLTEVNDPLINSLSVTTPRWIDRLTMGFGYHVEHHLFPAMSTRHAPPVRDLLIARWPERYQSMPLWRALLRLARTARVYKSDTVLVDPRSGREWQTLAPRRALALPSRGASA